MEIERQGFSSILEDNDLMYQLIVQCCIFHADPEATLKFDKSYNQVRGFITPSEKDFRQHIIDNLLGVHKWLHLKLIFSKSLERQKIISYHINLDN